MLITKIWCLVEIFKNPKTIPGINRENLEASISRNWFNVFWEVVPMVMRIWHTDEMMSSRYLEGARFKLWNDHPCTLRKYEILLVLTSYCLALTSLTVDWLIIMYKVSNYISWYLSDQWLHISLALHAWNKIGTGWESCVYKKIWLTMWFIFFAVEIIYPYIVSDSISPLMPKLWLIILLSKKVPMGLTVI